MNVYFLVVVKFGSENLGATEIQIMSTSDPSIFYTGNGKHQKSCYAILAARIRAS